MSNRNITETNKYIREVLHLPSQEHPVLVLRHFVSLNKSARFSNEKIPWYFEYKQKADYIPYNQTINVIFKKPIEYLLLESRTNKNISSQYDEYVKCKLFYKDFVDLKNALITVEKWFDIQDLYMLDEDDKIIDLKSSYNELLALVFFKGSNNGRFISFQPCVIFDKQITYPGIEIKCEQGIIASISFDEFLTLKLTLDEYINNFNLFSMNLMQMAYLHSIGLPSDANPMVF